MCTLTNFTLNPLAVGSAYVKVISTKITLTKIITKSESSRSHWYCLQHFLHKGVEWTLYCLLAAISTVYNIGGWTYKGV